MSLSCQKDSAKYGLPADIFPSIRYFVSKRHCSIRVLAASKGDGYESERLLACAETASIRGSKKQSVTVEAATASRDYTYVVLWFEHVYFVRVAGGQTHRISTRHAHHVTLAYLPALSELQRKRMEEGLNELLSSWWSEDYSSRPYALLRFRKFLVGRPKSEWLKTLHPSHEYHISTLSQWPDKKTVFTFRETTGVCDDWRCLQPLIHEDLLRFATPPREWLQAEDLAVPLTTSEKEDLFYRYVLRDRNCFPLSSGNRLYIWIRSTDHPLLFSCSEVFVFVSIGVKLVFIEQK